ncbi:MAG: NADH-quinone oxidoreductase subunit C [Bacteroidota bacterium]
MKDDTSNTEPKVTDTPEPTGLKYSFTPRRALAEEAKKANPHAKATTHNPEVVDALRAEFGERIGEVVEYANEQTVFVQRSAIADVCGYLKDAHGFNVLVMIGCIDRFTETERFEVFYNLVAIDPPKRLRLKVRVDDGEAVPTVTGVYHNANWHEREGWDFMGIRFEGHPDLRRMFMPEDFEYHPHRKEFPTLGIPGSLPLPNQETDGELTLDPFARAHGDLPQD